MTEPRELNCHPASHSEQIKAFENVFDVWPHAKTVEEHLALRLASPQHNRAKWFVGCLGDLVVASLGCYPMTFHLRGRVVKGIAIGAVHTLPAYRGQGYAAQLLRWVEQHQSKRGTEISLLFSDIDPQYYARLGYVLCPAWEGWIDLNRSVPINPTGFRLAEFSPQSELSGLRKAYDDRHRHLAFSIARGESYWNYVINKGRFHRYYWVIDSAEKRRGYISVSAAGRDWTIQDWVVDDRQAAEVIALLFQTAKGLGIEKVGGWCSETPAFHASFRLTPRQMEITMLKFLDGKQKADRDIQIAAGFISEIDHV